MPRLLIVDDDVHVRRLLRITLRDLVDEIDEAGSGEEAMGLVSQHIYDVILLDLILPSLGGLRICQRMPRVNGKPHVIVLTGDESEQTRQLATDCGANGFVVKPFGREEIRGKVQEGLAS